MARAPKPRGIATEALRKHLDRAREAAGFHGHSAWDRQVGAGFGRPGAQRRIREYPVSEQERMVARYQARDRANRKRTVGKAWDAILDPGPFGGIGALDDLLPVALNTSQHSTNVNRPRALRGGYDSKSETVRIQYRDGAVYEYYEVPKDVWRRLLRSRSTGKFVDAVLDTYPYTRINPATGMPTGTFTTGNPDFAGLFENPGGGIFGGEFHADPDDSWTGYRSPRAGSGWFQK